MKNQTSESLNNVDIEEIIGTQEQIAKTGTNFAFNKLAEKEGRRLLIIEKLNHFGKIYQHYDPKQVEEALGNLSNVAVLIKKVNEIKLALEIYKVIRNDYKNKHTNIALESIEFAINQLNQNLNEAENNPQVQSDLKQVRENYNYTHSTNYPRII